MNDYSGKICPYCKTAFTAHDDIVVCSECDMPHHKDCWVENQGCTTFGCLGTLKAVDNTASSVTATQMTYEDPKGPVAAADTGVVFCTQCGTRNAKTSLFCSGCGSRMAAAPQAAPQTAPRVAPQVQPNFANTAHMNQMNQPNVPYQPQSSYPMGGYNLYQQPYATAGIDADVQRLVGTKLEYYIPRFQMLKSTGKMTSWNWPAFLVAPFWMMYRKMYGYAAAVLAADVIISLSGSLALSLLALGGYVAIGILGNSIYMKYLETKVGQAKVMSEPYKSQFIATNGGVNGTATVLAIIGRIILGALMMG